MADRVFKSAPVYYDNKKVAELSGHTTSLDSGDEEQIGQDGFLGWSDGLTMMTIEADMVSPVAGISVPLLINMINKKIVTVGVPVDGKFLQSEMRVTNMKYTSDSKAGSLKCSATLKGPQPSLSLWS
jgi:hypothetical protein